MYTAFCYALIVLAIILCINSNVKNKVMWIIFSLYSIGFYHVQSVGNTQTKILLFNFLRGSSYYRFIDKTYDLIIVVPIYAIIFLILRKRLEAKNSSSGTSNED